MCNEKVDIKTVEHIVEVYTKKCEEENYNNNDNINVLIAANEVLIYYPKINTEADRLTFGEFSRRFKSAVEELKILCKETDLIKEE